MDERKSNFRNMGPAVNPEWFNFRTGEMERKPDGWSPGSDEEARDFIPFHDQYGKAAQGLYGTYRKLEPNLTPMEIMLKVMKDCVGEEN